MERIRVEDRMVGERVEEELLREEENNKRGAAGHVEDVRYYVDKPSRVLFNDGLPGLQHN